MSKSIRSYPESERKEVIKRRLQKETFGLGYWAAYDAEYRINIKNARAKVVKETVNKEK